jgi:hypothetical protein
MKLSFCDFLSNFRTAVASAAVFFLVFFYMIPIAFAQSLVNITELEARLPFLKYVLEPKMLAPIP